MLLQCDAPLRALRSFTYEATAKPDDAAPKVGYALAAGGVGDYSTGIWAMQRAIRINPEGVEYLRLDRATRRQLTEQIGKYERIRYRQPGDEGPRFMVAALHYLLDEPQAARAALGEAPARGWKFTSTRRLERLINERLADWTPVAAAKTGEPPENENQALAMGAAPAAASKSADPPTEPTGSESVENPEQIAQANPADAVQPPQTPPARQPAEDIDYVRIRDALLQASSALNAFTQKLSAQIDQRKRPVETEAAQAPGSE